MPSTFHHPVRTVSVGLGPRSYEILVERGLLVRLGMEVARHVFEGEAGGRLAVIITEPTIDQLYGQTVVQSLTTAGFRTQTVSLVVGETRKTLQTVERAYEALREAAADRRTIVVALGGGVIGDLAGFVAATYNRGLDFVQVPTTVLAQVDSSVGGKVGVNFGSGKNLIGAFYQPRLVAIDPDTLLSLPERERRSGFAEVIKYGIIDDKPFLHTLVQEADALLSLRSEHLEAVIAHSCQIKAHVVGQDEREDGLRAILNYGHTIGHALESVTQYRMFTHGEAIALGMVSAALIGESMGLSTPEETQELLQAFLQFGFEVRLPPELLLSEITRLLALDKKSVSGEARFVLMDTIGHVTAGHIVPLELVHHVLKRQQNPNFGGN